MSDNNVSTGNGLLILLVVGGIVGYLVMDEKGKTERAQFGTPTRPSQKTAPPARSRDRYSMKQYNQLKSGMTYEEVCKIMGGQGQELSRMSLGDEELAGYMWQNDSGGNLQCQFQGNKMSSKAQFGLR